MYTYPYCLPIDRSTLCPYYCVIILTSSCTLTGSHIRDATVVLLQVRAEIVDGGIGPTQLGRRRILAMEGGPAVTSTFLQGLMTADIEPLAERGVPSVYAFFLNNKGKVLFDTFLYAPPYLSRPCELNLSTFSSSSDTYWLFVRYARTPLC